MTAITQNIRIYFQGQVTLCVTFDYNKWRSHLRDLSLMYFVVMRYDWYNWWIVVCSKNSFKQ